ncbi:hypothetical protein [Bizionia arctica]|uniref:hypothetical protein n=1 Tax=Bizionia arctica TaxID=1495645 RepID=UPI00166A605F|nr:hypothetical protein [Bizionia arctica]
MLIVSCNSDDEKDNNTSANHHAIIIQNIVEFRVSSNTNIDLLNPDNTNAFFLEDIKLYYEQNGVLKEINNPIFGQYLTLVSPVESGEEYYYIAVELNTSNLENAITYIEWNSTDTDTITANYRSGQNFTFLTKAWYNGELIFDEDNIPEALPEIIK